MFRGRAEPADAAEDRPASVAEASRGASQVLDLRPSYERPAIQPIRRHRWRVLALATAFGDVLAIGLAILLANLLIPHHGELIPSPKNSPLSWLLPWWFGLAAAGLYDVRRTENPVEELRRIVNGVTIAAAIVIVASFSLSAPLSRAWTILTWGIALVTVAAFRRLVRKIVHALRRRGRLRRRGLIIGTDITAFALARDVRNAPWEGLDVVGFVAPNGETQGSIPGADPVVGDVADLRDLAVALAVSDVLVAPGMAANGSLAAIVSSLDGVPVELRVAPELDGFLTTHLSVQPMGDRALVAIERTELRPAARVGKRLLDLVVGAAIVLIALPFIAIAALAIRLDSPGPAFFRQRRVGHRGRAFTMWKLRTMSIDAEDRLTELEERNEGGELLFKVREDPRVTRVGRILRRSSLDELPQLFNVVTGKMSLVGPRPPLPAEVERYDERLGRRLLVKPGITGLWQVSGRTELGVDDYIRYDLLYVQNWSFALDLFILARTVPAIISGRGAY